MRRSERRGHGNGCLAHMPVAHAEPGFDAGGARAGAAGGLAPAAGVLLDPQNYFGSGDITITSDTVFDTISGMVSPNVWGPGSADINAGGSGLTAFTAHNITITAGAHVSYVGSYAFALLAKGNIVVAAPLARTDRDCPAAARLRRRRAPAQEEWARTAGAGA